MSRRIVKVTQTIYDTRTATVPVLFEDAIGLYNEDETSVIFNAACTIDGGPPLFDADFIEKMVKAGKINEHDQLQDVPPELFAFNHTEHIPIRGWGFE